MEGILYKLAATELLSYIMYVAQPGQDGGGLSCVFMTGSTLTCGIINLLSQMWIVCAKMYTGLFSVLSFRAIYWCYGVHASNFLLRKPITCGDEYLVCC